MLMTKLHQTDHQSQTPKKKHQNKLQIGDQPKFERPPKTTHPMKTPRPNSQANYLFDLSFFLTLFLPLELFLFPF